MTLKFENPNELKEIASREIKDGKVVLKAAGLGKINRVDVEVVRDGQSETVPIPPEGEAFDAAWQVYSSYDKPDHSHKTA